MSRTFTKVGVVGLGTMGAGIVEVFARSGLAGRRGRARPRPRSSAVAATCESSTDRAVKRGKLTEDEQDAIFGRVTLHDVAGRPGRRRPRRSRRCPSTSTSSSEIFAALDKICRPDAILATNTSSLSVTEISVATEPARAGRRHALLQPGAGAEARRGRAAPSSPSRTSSTTSRRSPPGSARRRSSSATRPGFIANALLFGYLNHAVAMFESRYATREDIDAAMRLGCGYPMGPLALLDLIGLDTAYEILDTMYRQSPRPAARARADPQADGHGGAAAAARPGAASTPTRRRTRPSVVDDALTPAAGAERRRGRATSQQVGVVGSGTMATGIVEVLAKAGYDVLYVTRGEEKVARRARRARAVAGQGACCAASSSEADRDAALARVTRLGAARRPGRLRPRRRGRRRGAARSSRRCSRPSTRSASRARCSRPRPRRCRSSSCAAATGRPARRRRAALLQPGAGDEARRGRPHRLDRRRRRRPPREAVCEQAGKHAGRVRRPGRLHRQRAAVPLPQRRGQDAARPTTRRSRTSTPR